MKVYLKTFSDCGAKLVKYFTQMYIFYEIIVNILILHTKNILSSIFYVIKL